MSEFIFPIQPLLIKRLHIYYPDICELFGYVRIKVELLEKYKKHWIQNGHALKKTEDTFYIRISPVHNSKS